jgi:hypothetical protein
MPACLHSLRDNHVGTGIFSGFGFRDRRCVGEPPDALTLHFGDERFRIEPHDGRNDRRTDFQHGLALRGEIGRCHVAGVARHLWAPTFEKIPHSVFRGSIAPRWRVGYP